MSGEALSGLDEWEELKPTSDMARQIVASADPDCEPDLKHLDSRHCEPTGRPEAPPDDRLREAIQLSYES